MTNRSQTSAVDHGTEPVEYAGASVEAISNHYDVSNDFYALWLDPSLTYSCALWEDSKDSLDTAQMRKLDYLATQAHARSATRVLDVGCGWGAMMTRLLDYHGVASVTGLTLSAEQVDYVRARNDPRVEIRMENWADHQPTGQYDAIISIGAMEHFAALGLSRPERIASYRDFFTRCADWLPAGGRLGLQTIVRGNNLALDWSMTREMVFVNSQIFRESEVPWISEVMEASEGLMDLCSLRNDAQHYARTCGEWLKRLTMRRAEAIAMVGEKEVTKYERYLRASVRAFELRHGGLARMVFERV